MPQCERVLGKSMCSIVAGAYKLLLITAFHVEGPCHGARQEWQIRLTTAGGGGGGAHEEH